MNPLFNPLIGLPFIKNYLLDPKRLQRLNPTALRRYQNKAFRHIVKYAYSVPLYRTKYKTAGIHPSDIRGIQDIVKLPFITKKDLTENFPDNIIPPQFNKKTGF